MASNPNNHRSAAPESKLSGTQSFLALDPRVKRDMFQGMDTMQQQTGQFQGGLMDTLGQFQTNFQGFQPSNQLDQFSQNLVSQGQQGILNQAAAQNRQIAGSGMDPAVARVLQAQGNSRAALQQNPLMLAAAQQQQGREAQNYQLNQQAQNMSNAALGQRAQLEGTGLQSQQNLLSMLGQMGQLTGKQIQVQQDLSLPELKHHRTGFLGMGGSKYLEQGEIDARNQAEARRDQFLNPFGSY